MTDEQKNLQQHLEMLYRQLGVLERQIAGHGELNAPPGMIIQRDLSREKIIELEAKLKLPEFIRAYINRTLVELERYEDLNKIVFPTLKPSSGKMTGARREEERVRAFLSGFDPKFSPRNPTTLKPNEQNDEEELAPVLFKNTRVILLGESGAGKSTALRELFREYATKWQEKYSQLVPIFVLLNRWQEGLSLLGFLQKEAGELKENLLTLLEDGKILLLLDGLNELPNLKRNEKTSEIDDLRSKMITAISTEFPKVLCVLSCRVKEFVGGPPWYALHILPLTKGQVEAIARSYFEEETEKALQLITELYDEKREKLQTLTERPFYLRRLLSFFGTIGEIPENPALLLAYSVELSLNTEVDKGLLQTFEKEELNERLSLLAFNMTEASTLSINLVQAEFWCFTLPDKPRRDLEKIELIVQDDLESNKTQGIEALRMLEKGSGTGLLLVNREEVKFSHQLLQEYFCTVFLQKQGLTPEWLSRTCSKQFSTVWLLWIGLESRILTHLLDWLTSKSQPFWIHFYVILALDEIRDTRMVVPLITALQYKLSDTVRNAAFLLGELPDRRAVEPLIQLLQNPDNLVRSNVVEALGKIGDRRAAEPLAKIVLENSDKLVTSQAIEALGKIGDRRAVEPLIKIALDDSENWLSSQAIEALGKIGDARAIKPLVKILQTPHSLFNREASEALVKIGKQAVEPLLQLPLYKRSSGNINIVATIILSRTDGSGNPIVGSVIENPVFQDVESQIYFYGTKTIKEIGIPAVEPLINALGNEDNNLCTNAIIGLRELGELAVEPLILALQSPKSRVSANAAYGLGLIKDKRAVTPLIQMLQAPDKWLRNSAAGALGIIKDLRSINPLIHTMIIDPIIWVRYSAIRALTGMGKPATYSLIQLLKFNEVDDEIFYFGVLALREIGEDAIEALIDTLQYPELIESFHVGEALIIIGELAVAPLIVALTHSSSRVRNFSAVILGRIKVVQAVEPLIIGLSDDNSIMRSSVAWALGHIGDRQAVKPLIKALKDPSSEVCYAAAEALGKIGDKRALLELKQITIEDTRESIYGYVNDAALEAINEILDRIKPRLLNEAYCQTSEELFFQYIQSLIKALGNPEINAHLDAAEDLISIGEPAVGALIKALNHKSIRVRSSSALILGRIRSRWAVEPLIKSLSDADITMRYSVTWALGLLGNEKALPELELLASKDIKLTSWGEKISDKAKWSIKEIKARLQE